MRVNMFSVILYLVVVIVFVHSIELPSWHNKPLGSHIEPNKVDESFLENPISQEDFANKYVIPRKPIVFRNVVKEWPAFKLWTDEYLTEKYGELELRLEGKKEKGSGIPKGDVCLGRDRMKTFLKEYRSGVDKYVVSELPTPMWHEVKLPSSVSCGEFLESFVEIDLWINSDLGEKGNGGNSIIHKDAFNTINCVVSGSKEWKLIELKYNDYLYQSWEGPMDAGYGGFSLVDPDKVDAKRFSNIGKIPQWQFTTINAGDCLYLPSQMWHQVKSFGEVNRAVAFLFNKFDKQDKIKNTSCEKNQKPILLSEVDVDLQYPGTGPMYMGQNELYSVMQDLKDNLVDPKKGYITKRRIYRIIYSNHGSAAKVKELLTKKAKEMYAHLLKLAGGKKEQMTQQFVDGLTRDQARPAYLWMFPMEPANSYLHEYSYFLPEELEEMITELLEQYEESIPKDVFMKAYEGRGGTKKFGEDIWEVISGGSDRETASDITEETLVKAFAKYTLYRREDPTDEESDDEATITTPQGHISQTKREHGIYTGRDENGGQEKQQGGNKDEL